MAQKTTQPQKPQLPTSPTPFVPLPDLAPCVIPQAPARLARAICTSIRAFAGANITDFKNGAIAIRFEANHPALVSWLFGNEANGFYAGDGTYLDFVFRIAVDGNKTRPAGWRQNAENLECACAGHVMLKLEACAYAVTQGLGRCSEAMPESAETYGRAADPGAICYDLLYVDDQHPTPLTGAVDPINNSLLRIYVGVSGATGAEDRRCAEQATSVLLSCLSASRERDHLQLFTPLGTPKVID